MFRFKNFGKYKFFVVICILGVLSLIPSFSRLQDLVAKNKEVRSNIKQVTLKNKILYERQYRLQTDPVYAESVARQKLNVAKEGEMIFKINPKEK